MISPSWSASLTLWIRGAVLMCLVAVQPTASSGLTLISSDPTAVAQFQTGATIESFDDLSALTITSYDNGQTVPAANQFSSRNLITFTSPFFNSGGASFNDPVGNPGTPIGIFDPDGAIAADVKSPNNVAGPLVVVDGSIEAFNNGFMEVIFPADVIRVGFWVTQGTITLFLKDSTNTNLATGDVMVTGSAGQFIGIQRDTADVRGVTIGFTQAFTIDDFTYSTTPIPEPSSFLMIAMGLTVLVGLRRVR
jgi:PEP-CTERM motif